MEKNQIKLTELDKVTGGIICGFDLGSNVVSCTFYQEDIENIKSNNYDCIVNVIKSEFYNAKSVNITESDVNKIKGFLINNKTSIINRQYKGMGIDYQITTAGADIITDIQGYSW